MREFTPLYNTPFTVIFPILGRCQDCFNHRLRKKKKKQDDEESGYTPRNPENEEEKKDEIVRNTIEARPSTLNIANFS